MSVKEEASSLMTYLILDNSLPVGKNYIVERLYPSESCMEERKGSECCFQTIFSQLRLIDENQVGLRRRVHLDLAYEE
jgi:hypothetical protein